ncbi:hypothetical protein VPH35_051565 [Triticum aestivum]
MRRRDLVSRSHGRRGSSKEEQLPARYSAWLDAVLRVRAVADPCAIIQVSLRLQVRISTLQAGPYRMIQ